MTDQESAQQTAKEINAYWKARGKDARAREFLDVQEVNGIKRRFWTVKSQVKGWWV